MKTVYPLQTKFAGGIMDARTDNVKTVYPLQTKFAGGINMQNLPSMQTCKELKWYMYCYHRTSVKKLNVPQTSQILIILI